jgi:hypothetical protein
VTELFPDAVKIVTMLTGATYYATLIAVALLLLFHILAVTLPVAKSVAEFAMDPQTAARTASMQEVRAELGKLIRQATPMGSKFVIFIDDLDRCRPPRSVDVLEAINQLLDHAGVVVVLLSDMQVVARAVEIKYKDFAALESTKITNHLPPGSSKYGWNFLQKIIQLQFDLPIYPIELIRHMVEDLASQVSEERRYAGWMSSIWQIILAKARRAIRKLTYPIRPADIILNVLGLMAVGSILFAAYLAWSRSSSHYTLPSRRIIIGLGAGAVARSLTEMTKRIFKLVRESRRREHIDDQIRERIAAGETDFSRVEAYVREHTLTRANDPEIEGFVRERLQRYLEDESEIQREAEGEVMLYLDPMPRHAKRLLNRLRLLLFIAHERGMFGGTPILSAKHIGKWAVLGERWPELLQVVCMEPFVMGALENSKEHDECVKTITPAYENDDALRRFCLSPVGVRLSPVIQRIVEFARS